MKRFLALLLTLVMLVSVCGLQAFAADGDTPADTGDELVVYTRSGATRTFHVGDTFSYTYWFRLTSGSVNKITGHVLYDSQCLKVNADGCKFPNMTSASTKDNAGDFEFHDTFTTTAGGQICHLLAADHGEHFVHCHARWYGVSDDDARGAGDSQVE